MSGILGRSVAIESRKSFQREEDLATQGFRVKNGAVLTCNGIGLKNMLQAGRRWLESHVHIVNALNVFPVPDGDTGINMLLTMRSALEETEQTVDQRVGVMAQAVAHGALMGARGNSGVILSQFLHGLALGLEGKATFTAEVLAHATQLGVEKAYQSMVEPVEGTILTVARQAALAAQQSAGRNHQDLLTLLNDIVAGAKLAQAKTPELLPVLKEAGVTDSGGQGLVYILEGALRFIRAEPVSIDLSNEATPRLKPMPGADAESYGYDVQFLIRGSKLDLEEIRAQMNGLGQSTLVVGDEHIVKVHLHTADPGLSIRYGASQGIVEDVIIQDMEEQARQFLQERIHNPLNGILPVSSKGAMLNIATICVAPGDGLAQIFHSLGVNQVLSGGQTMNPSTQELLEAINLVEADTVLVLPNHSNAISAARQAGSLSSKNVQVIPTKTVPQGIAALLSFNYQADLASNVQRMLDAVQQVQTIEVAQAVRDSTFDGFKIKAGDVVGFLNNRLQGIGQSFEEVVLDLLAKIEIEPYEILTLYFGQDSSPDQARHLADNIEGRYPELEIDIHQGGQSHYQYIISLE